MQPRKLGEGLLLLPGSPSTLLVPTDSGLTLVDPGYPAERARDLVSAISALGRGEVTVILTHSTPTTSRRSLDSLRPLGPRPWPPGSRSARQRARNSGAP